MLVTQRVENLSLADARVHQTTLVSVGYDSDVRTVMALLLGAAQAQSRVLADPAPTASLSNFGADGLEFTLGYWVDDLDRGQLNLRSEINLAVLAAFRQNGIDIPYPQRVVHQR
jgi:small-conductance mechanosensitive channel